MTGEISLFSDGECPSCGAPHLHLNTSDLLECPCCNMVCAGADGIVATVMPFLGTGSFRLEDTRVMSFCGTAFAPSKAGGVAADDSKMFKTAADLNKYLSSLTVPATEQSKGQHLARLFLKSFKQRILAAELDDLQRVSTSKRARTNFYAISLLPGIATDLGMLHGTEEFKVDHVAATFSRNKYEIPMIYVESENDFAGATHEIRKLCSLNSPLRVLITFARKEFDPEPASGAYAQLREWQLIIREHNEFNEDFRGAFVIIVARFEKGGLNFSACTFRKNGDLTQPLSRLVMRELG